jgi:hypothetical protein
MSSFLPAAPEQDKSKQARDRSKESTRLMIVIGSIGFDAALQYSCVAVTDYS